MLMIGDWGLVLLANALVIVTVPYCTAGSSARAILQIQSSYKSLQSE